jgi:CRISPR-associated protein Csm2
MAHDNKNKNRGGRNDNRSNEAKPFDFSIFKEKYKKWIQEEIDDDCINFMDKFGLFLCDKSDKNASFPGFKAVTTSQMRNIFSEVKRIEVKVIDQEQYDKNRSYILLLRPKIAYSTARVLASKRDSRMIELREVLEKCLLAIENYQQFKRFSQIFEGIIAYHKVYGGKD